ncbi:MAG: response regulator [Candidatus Omnitrophota bacterium]|nr:response regulator [Candidatus Omnitrophota bacterium]
MNVLVVDDEVEVVNFFSIFLRRLGLNVEKATCGQEALELFSRHKPEWVFLDIKMPDINGLDLLKQMKEIDIGIKAMMISGRDDNSDQDEARALGASEYLIKPIDLDEMRKIIKKYIPEQEQIPAA